MTLVTPTPPWSREKLLGRIDGSVKRISRPGLFMGYFFLGKRSRIMRKVFLSFLGKIGQVLEVLINPGEARVGSEVSGLGKNFPSMVSIVHRQKSTSPPNL